MQTKLNLTFLMKDVTNIQIVTLKIEQKAQPNGKWIRSKFGESNSSSQDWHRSKYNLPVNHLRFTLHRQNPL